MNAHNKWKREGGRSRVPVYHVTKYKARPEAGGREGAFVVKNTVYFLNVCVDLAPFISIFKQKVSSLRG